MPDQSYQDKTEPATPKKREEARKKGQTAKSRELSSVAVLITGTIFMFFTAKGMTLKLGETIRRSFFNIPQALEGNQVLFPMLNQAVVQFLWMILPIMLALCIAAILSNLLQSGFIFSVEPLTPTVSKIDPIKGAGKLLSKRSFAELSKSIFKIIIVRWIC